MSNRRRYYDEIKFRVWPDGTVQAVEDGEPYSHMSDDYQIIWALDEADALAGAGQGPDNVAPATTERS